MNIADIGQDAAIMGLPQTQLASVNPVSLITMSVPNDLTDGEYLVWGNEGGNNTYTTSDVPGGVCSAWKKSGVWPK